MARILYAASGDGYGHAVRAHSVGAGLLARGHDVRFVSSHKTIQYLSSFFPDRLHEVFGLLTTYVEGSVQIWTTLVSNLQRAGQGLGTSLRALDHLLVGFDPDLVITDFEPFTALRARRRGIPFISLDNQHLLTHCVVDHPAGYRGDRLNAYLAIRIYFGGAKRYLVTSFIPAPVRYHSTTVVAPILRSSVYDRVPRDDGFLLAYMGASGSFARTCRVLERDADLPVRAYGFGREGSSGRVEFKRTDPHEFLNDLASCRAVIATAGHSLVSECLHLEKPMLLAPIQRQYEQVLNAYHVQKLGVGRACNGLDASTLREFLAKVDSYRAALSHRPKAELAPILDAIEKEIP